MSQQLRAFLTAVSVIVGLTAAGYGVAIMGAAVVSSDTDTVVEQSGRSDGWRGVRTGTAGRVSIPDPQAGVLIQSDGEIWRSIRNGPVTVIGAWGMFAMLVLLVLFYAWRGRIALAGKPTHREVVRFNGIERFAHWMTATSFIVLALSGLNLLYGRYLFIPVIGKEAFATVTEAGKVLHNFVAFPFMFGVVLMFVLWVRHNLPARTDLNWIRQGGGLFSDRHHPAADRFNTGQKAIFWIVVLGGISVSLSGLALLLPFAFPMFGKTFAFLNLFGFGFPETLTSMQEMQLAQLWHSVVSLGLIVVMFAHIYIGTIGMEGAFQAMGSGRVDAAWAEQHHSLWAASAEEAPAEDDAVPSAVREGQG